MLSYDDNSFLSQVKLSSLGFPSMTDSENERSVFADCVYHSVVADTKFPKTSKSCCQGREHVRFFGELFLDFSYDPVRLIFAYLSEVTGNGLFECYLIAQALSSYLQW